MLGASASFKASIAEVEGVLQESDVAIESARTLFLDVSDMVNGAVEELTAEVTALNAKTTNTSQTVMIMMIIVGWRPWSPPLPSQLCWAG